MPNANFWSVKEPIDTFFFDCDGTLSLIEGIDVLATTNGVAQKVHGITERCMSTTGINLNAYRERLDYVQPTLSQLHELAALYAAHRSPGVYETIQLLHRLNKEVYVLSGGIKEAVSQFAQTLGIPASHVLAVDVYFDEEGKYIGFNEQSNLAKPNGKAIEIASILKSGERSVLIGDGVSDWEAQETVTRFIGFAGCHAKEKVRKNAEFFITNTSFFPLIPLGLTQEESMQLSPTDYAYYEQGLTDIQNSVVLMRDHDHV